MTIHGTRIQHDQRPVVPSPSGLPTQHLICQETGSSTLFVGQQWLETGERVFRHTHPCDEGLMFLSGAGEATLDDETVPIGPGVSLFIPAGVLHGFTNTGKETLHVIVTFPVPYFAPTDFVEAQ